MSLALTTAIRVFHATQGKGQCPLTVNEGKKYIAENFVGDINTLPFESEVYTNREIALQIKEGYFRYERDLPDVLKGIDIDVYKNEILCILGANGAGKTTLLRVLSSVKRLYKGKLGFLGAWRWQFNFGMDYLACCIKLNAKSIRSANRFSDARCVVGCFGRAVFL